MAGQDVSFLAGPRRQISSFVSQGLGISQPRRISIEGGRFHLVDETGAELPAGAFDQQMGVYLDLVICDGNEHISKVYYEAAYDPNAKQFQPPDCWSDNGVAPSANASRPQSPTCASCPNNVWGSDVSAISGKNTKACADKKKLAAIVGTDAKPYLLAIPPASLKFFRAYNEWIAKQQVAGRACDISDVVTRVFFPQPNTLDFRVVSLISPEIAKIEDHVWSNKLTDDIVGRLDKPLVTGAILTPPRPVGQPGSLATPQALPQESQRPLPPPQPQPNMSVAGAAPTPLPSPSDGQILPSQGGSVTTASPSRGRPRTRQVETPGQVAPLPATQAQIPSNTLPGADANSLDIPDFLQRPAPGGIPSQQGQQRQQPQQQQKPQPQSGIAAGTEASPEMMRAIEDTFKLPV